MKDYAAMPATALLASCPTALMVLDPQGQILAHNPALLELTGLDAGALGSTPAPGGPVAKLLALRGEGQWTRADGRPLTLRVDSAILDDGAEARWILDLSETRHLQAELRAQSLTDEVTGLLNARGVTLALEPQVARARRYNTPMAMIMMEAGADQAGPQLQVQVARLLKDQLRWADIIGCTEQHEFILVLPETSREDALKLADKLSKHLAEFATAPEQAPQSCYGVTEWRKSDSAATLLQRAATALLQARDEQQGMAVAL
jgi:diguanylate cyclase (GGDEF)-like protein